MARTREQFDRVRIVQLVEGMRDTTIVQLDLSAYRLDVAERYQVAVARNRRVAGRRRIERGKISAFQEGHWPRGIQRPHWCVAQKL